MANCTKSMTEILPKNQCKIPVTIPCCSMMFQICRQPVLPKLNRLCSCQGRCRAPGCFAAFWLCLLRWDRFGGVGGDVGGVLGWANNVLCVASLTTSCYVVQMLK